ncbi:MAG: Ig-like domain-containing protein [Gemmatimonadaceae bacterium]|nr:Ig-like domain-containing protein [Gemmatimonadaceae bacterium]
MRSIRHAVPAILATVVACSGGADSPSGLQCSVASVSVAPATQSVVAGSTVGFVASVAQSNCANVVVAWTSSNAAVATVASDGTVSGIAPGQATISAAFQGSTGTASITVLATATSVTLTPATVSVRQGASVQLIATPRDAAGAAIAGRTVQFSSGDAAVASVSTTGLVTGISAGDVTVTASIDGKVATSRVSVLGAVDRITVAPASATLPVGGFQNLNVVIHDAAGHFLTDRTVSFATSDASIATVSPAGQVTGVAPGGPVTITVSAEGRSASMQITFTPVVASVTVEAAATGLMGVGETRTYSAVVRNAAGTVISFRPVTWSTSDTAIAVVSSSGVLTPRRTGTVTVRAASDGVQGTLAQQIVIARPAQRVAWALVPLDAAGQTLTASALNATGGAVRAVRTATGEYTVTFARMARLDATYVDVTMISMLEGGGAATRCHANSTQNAPNGEDLEVRLTCYATDGTRQDSYTYVLVVGNGSLDGRHSFLTSSNASASHTPPASQSWSSAGATNSVSRSAAGTYSAAVNNPRPAQNTPENYFVSTVGDGSTTCWNAGWSFGTFVNVSCDNLSAAGDALFSVLMLEAGRPGARYGFMWSQDAAGTLDTDFTPSLTYQRTSSGQPIAMRRTATGRYRVSVPGLSPDVNGRYAHVQITPYGQENVYCKASAPAPGGGDIAIVTVSCANRGSHAPVNSRFTLLLID